jgi:predicted GNAT superfamily acetyltransferase
MYRYTMRKIAEELTEHVTLRIPRNWVEAFKGMADKENPWRAIMRDALKQYLKRLGLLQ